MPEAFVGVLTAEQGVTVILTIKEKKTSQILAYLLGPGAFFACPVVGTRHWHRIPRHLSIEIRIQSKRGTKGYSTEKMGMGYIS